MSLRATRAPWGAQPASLARLAPEIAAARPSFLYVPAWGEKDCVTQQSPFAAPSSFAGSAIGFDAKSLSGAYQKWADVPSRYSAKRSVLVYLIPDEGLPSPGSRRVWTDFNGTTYSFVLTFDTGAIALFVHNGTTGASAAWSTSVTPGVPMAIMGTFDGATAALYVNGQRRATASLSGSLRSTSAGIGLGGNPAGAAEDLDAQFVLALQVGEALPQGLCEQLTANPWAAFVRPVVEPVSAGGGAQTVTIGQATETDSAQAFVAAQARAIGQVSETDSAQTLTSLLTAAIGQAAETDSAQALQAAQSRAIAQATETDSATAIGAAQSRAIAQATETDEAIAVAAAQARAIAQATETDAAQAFTAAQARAIGQAAESDAAQPVAYAAPGSIAQAQESDSAQPIVVHHRIAIGQAAETDAAQAVAVSNGITVAIGMALEIDVVLPLAGLRMGFGQAAETDTARTIAALLAGEHVASQRVYIVHDELRTYMVPDEDRVYLVPDSNGTLSI